MSPTPRIAIASCREVLERSLDDDEPRLRAALERRGVASTVAAWDDPEVDWAAHDLVVVRSTWDYVPRREAFLAWAEQVEAATRLANPASVLRWSTDKRYLAQLAAAGVPVVPTTLVEPDEVLRLEPGPHDLVVKPAVSAGSRDTLRHPGPERDAALRHAQALQAQGRAVVVQPYLEQVDLHGETAMVQIDGRHSHAARKAPILEPGVLPAEGLFAVERMSDRQATPAELAAADAALAAVAEALPGADLLYARVDLVPDEAERPLVLEVELAEPSLFLAHDEAAAERLAAAVAARLTA